MLASSPGPALTLTCPGVWQHSFYITLLRLSSYDPAPVKLLQFLEELPAWMVGMINSQLPTPNPQERRQAHAALTSLTLLPRPLAGARRTRGLDTAFGQCVQVRYCDGHWAWALGWIRVAHDGPKPSYNG